MTDLEQQILDLIGSGRRTAFQINETIGESIFPPGTHVCLGSSLSCQLKTQIIVSYKDLRGLSTAAIVSSRLQKDWENQTKWFDQLRTAVLNAKRDQSSILTIAKTTCDRFLRRACDLFNCRWFSIETANSNSIRDWLKTLWNETKSDTIWVWQSQNRLSRDDLLIQLSRKIFVLRVNQQGETRRRITELLTNQSQAKPVFISTDNSLVNNEMRHHFVRLGAISWHLSDKREPCAASTTSNSQQPDRNIETHPETFSRLSSGKRIIPLAEFHEQDQYLFHCTRSRTGPWPDQDSIDFIDELIFSAANPRSPVAVLARIVRLGTLLATSKLNRANASVVSFTDCNLQQIRNMKVYRSHLGRWDFEPYGIGISRHLMEQRFEARPVHYGTADEYQELKPTDQPFFQLAKTVTKSGAEIDWTKEREWRVIGDVEFESLGNPGIVQTKGSKDKSASGKDFSKQGLHVSPPICHKSAEQRRQFQVSHTHDHDPVVLFTACSEDAAMLAAVTDRKIIVVHG